MRGKPNEQFLHFILVHDSFTLYRVIIHVHPDLINSHSQVSDPGPKCPLVTRCKLLASDLVHCTVRHSVIISR